VGPLSPAMPLMTTLVTVVMGSNVKSFIIFSNIIEDGAGALDCCGRSRDSLTGVANLSRLSICL